jgi:anti-sigma regulatory factor (Ser/Thr protein kinase)
VTFRRSAPEQATLPYSVRVADAPPVKQSADPQAPLGHLSRLGFALVAAAAIDEVATSLLSGLAALPAVRRVGFALTEGGGRRLRFTASDRLAGGAVDWCHIDAYDDVPLTTVVRTGRPVMGSRDAIGSQFEEHISRQPDEVRALAAVPLPGIGSPIGGLVLFLDEEWAFDETQRGLLDATARGAADAVRRIRVGGHGLHDDEPEPDDDSTLSARVVLDDDPRAAGEARHFLRDFLGWGDVSEDLAAIAELCLSELVTNAIVHAGGRIELRANLDTALTVSVRDRGGPARDAAPDDDPDPLRVHGRGLQLVEALADRWGSERDAVGSRVWFSLELDSAIA